MKNTAPGDGFSLPALFVLMQVDKEPRKLHPDEEISLRIVQHRPGALGLRLGLAPDLRPAGSIQQLQQLLQRNAFWCQSRTVRDLRRMVRKSAICVTAWNGRTLIGFGRATSDGVYRGTIWDVVVDAHAAGRGIGKGIMEKLLQSQALAGCERIYLMTTNSSEFYKKLGFQAQQGQVLMIKEKNK